MNTIKVSKESRDGFDEHSSGEPFIPMSEFLKLAKGLKPGLGTREILEIDINLCMGSTALNAVDPEEER